MKKSKETDFTYKLNPIITKVGFGDTGGEPFLITPIENKMVGRRTFSGWFVYRCHCQREKQRWI